MFSTVPCVSVQPAGRGNGFVGSAFGVAFVPANVPSGSSSTMLGVGVPPLPAFPMNMCPALLTTTAWALLPLVEKGLGGTGVWATAVAGLLLGFRLAML